MPTRHINRRSDVPLLSVPTATSLVVVYPQEGRVADGNAPNAGLLASQHTPRAVLADQLLHPHVQINTSGDVGIGGAPDADTALTLHQDAAHSHILDLDASALTGADISLRFLLSNTLDAGIKATALGWLEFDADSGFNWRINGTEQWQMQANGHLIPVGARNIGESGNPVSHLFVNNIDGLGHLDVGGASIPASESFSPLTVNPRAGDNYGIEIVEDPTNPRVPGFGHLRGRIAWRVLAGAGASSVASIQLIRGADTSDPDPRNWEYALSTLNSRGSLEFSANTPGNTAHKWSISHGSGAFSPGADASQDIGSDTHRVRNIYADNYIGLGRWEQQPNETSDLTSLPGYQSNTTFTGYAQDPVFPDQHVIVSESANTVWHVGEGGTITTIDLTTRPRSSWMESGHIVYARAANPSITHDGTLFLPVYIGERQTVGGRYVYSGGRWTIWSRRLRARGDWAQIDFQGGSATAEYFCAPFAGGTDSEKYGFGGFYALHPDAFTHGDPLADNKRVQFFFHTEADGLSHVLTPTDGEYVTMAHDSTASFRGLASSYADDWQGGLPMTGSAGVESSIISDPPVSWDARASLAAVTDDGVRSWWLLTDGRVFAHDSFANLRFHTTDRRPALADRVATGLGRDGQASYDMAAAVIPDHASGKYRGIGRPRADRLMLLDGAAKQTDIVQYLLGLGGALVAASGGQTGGGQAAIPEFLTLDESNSRVGVNVASPQTTLDVLSPAWTAAQFKRQGGDGSARIKVGDYTYLEGATNGAAELRFGGIGGALVSNETLQIKRGSDLLLTVSYRGDVLPDDVGTTPTTGQTLGSEAKYWKEAHVATAYTSRVRPRTNAGHLEIGEVNSQGGFVTTGELRVRMNIGTTLLPGAAAGLGSETNYWTGIYARSGVFTDNDGVIGAGVVQAAVAIPHHSSTLGRDGVFPSPTHGQLVTVGDNLWHYVNGDGWRRIGGAGLTGEPPWLNFVTSIVPNTSKTINLGDATHVWLNGYFEHLAGHDNEAIRITAPNLLGRVQANSASELWGIGANLRAEIDTGPTRHLNIVLYDKRAGSGWPHNVVGSKATISYNQLSEATAWAAKGGAPATTDNGKVLTYNSASGRLMLADIPGASGATLGLSSGSTGIRISLGAGSILLTPGMIEATLAYTFSDSERGNDKVVRARTTGALETVGIAQLIPQATENFQFTRRILMDLGGTATGAAIASHDDRGSGIYWPDSSQIAIAVGDHDGLRFIGGAHTPTNVRTQILPEARADYGDFASHKVNLGSTGFEAFNEVHASEVHYDALMQASERARKQNIEASSFTDINAAFANLKVRKYELKAEPGVKRYGIVLEETTVGDVDTLLNKTGKVAASDLIYMLVRAYQTLGRREEELRTKLDALAAVMDSLPAVGGSVRQAVRGAGAAGRLTAFADEPDETVPEGDRATPP